MVEKRYQVFVSSTFRDLVEERKEVIQALLELDCIPSGMELFPAANEDQWTLIKKVIDDCDYYIVIIAGQYGSIGPDGISYTEMEYRYALERKKPVMGFIHKNISKLPYESVASDPVVRQKLDKFCELVKSKAVKFWDGADNLGSVVSRSLVQLIKAHPAKGWIRADNVPDESAAQEILDLRREIDRLKAEAETQEIGQPAGTQNLTQGQDKIEVECCVAGFTSGRMERINEMWECSIVVNDLIAAVTPCMIDEADQATIKKKIEAWLLDQEAAELDDVFPGYDVSLGLTETSFDTLLIQMIALGIIEKSTRTRSVKDTATYWRLTRYGEKMMYQLRALTKSSVSNE